MENMLSFIGKYNNNCKVYNSDITEEEISLLYSVLNAKEFAETVNYTHLKEGAWAKGDTLWHGTLTSALTESW